MGQALIVLGCSLLLLLQRARCFARSRSLAQAAAAVGAVLFALAGLEIVRGHIALGAGAIGLASVRTASMTMLIGAGLGVRVDRVRGLPPPPA